MVGIGATLAKRVEMTKMPRVVARSDALLDRFGGSLYRRCRGVRTVDLRRITTRDAAIPFGNRIGLFIGYVCGCDYFLGFCDRVW